MNLALELWKKRRTKPLAWKPIQNSSTFQHWFLTIPNPTSASNSWRTNSRIWSILPTNMRKSSSYQGFDRQILLMYILKHYIGEHYSVIYTAKTLLLASKSWIEVSCVVSSSFDGIDGRWVQPKIGQLDPGVSNLPSSSDNALHGKGMRKKEEAICTVSTTIFYHFSETNLNHNSNIDLEHAQSRLCAQHRRENR